MNYTSPFFPDLQYLNPDSMSAAELSLALYHIGAKTIVSESFSSGYVNKVTLRASQLLSKRAEIEQLSDEATDKARDVIEELLKQSQVYDPSIYYSEPVTFDNTTDYTLSDLEIDWSEPKVMVVEYGDDGEPSIDVIYSSDQNYPDW